MQDAAKTKACSGKCLGGGCSSSPSIWVIAACDGMISVFSKETDGHIKLVPQGEGLIASSIEEFKKFMSDATMTNSYKQLVVVGSPNDISWMRISLPENASKYVVAEIQYPLIAQWFKQDTDMKNLRKALVQLFT